MVKICRPEKKDLESVARFQVEMALETENMNLDWETVKKGVLGLFDNPEMGFYLLARRNDQTVGSLMVLYEWSDWRAGKVIWIHSVYIEKEFRNEGIFKSMYQYLQEMVKNSENLYGLRLYVDKRNTNAQEVYHRLGMDNQHYELYEWMK